jgi:hypothetical protein
MFFPQNILAPAQFALDRPALGNEDSHFSAAHGSGPFSTDVAHHSVLSMQLFLISFAG